MKWVFTPMAAILAAVCFGGVIGVGCQLARPKTDGSASSTSLVQPATGRLLTAAQSGGDYLARMNHPDGRFVYSYDPGRDRENIAHYNMLRHAGAIYALCELYEQTHQTYHLAAANRAIGYLKARIQPVTSPDDQSVLIDSGKMKLGGNALAIVALAQHARATGERTNLDLMQRLARWMLSTQSPEGEFQTHIRMLDSDKTSDHVSDYYPGEAILALLRLHDLDGDQRWLDAAAKAARWLILVRDRGLADPYLPHDHWLLYGLNELYRKQADDLYLQHARRLTKAIIAAQNSPTAPWPEWRGGWEVPPRTTPTSTRVEGLLAAAALFQFAGSADDASAARSAAVAGINFILRAQHQPRDHFPDADRASGGFGQSLSDPEVRIDYVQHAISALLAARRLGIDVPQSGQ